MEMSAVRPGPKPRPNTPSPWHASLRALLRTATRSSAPARPKKAGTNGWPVRPQASRQPGGAAVPSGTRVATADDVCTSPWVTAPDSQTSS